MIWSTWGRCSSKPCAQTRSCFRPRAHYPKEEQLASDYTVLVCICRRRFVSQERELTILADDVTSSGRSEVHLGEDYSSR
jgi:hypothetical protein